jgi:lipopolysaccharide cholinephosphotransferase
LVGGSALGAIRHNGFIPWDDDLDVGMLRNEYDLFLAAFDEIYHDKYLIMSPGNRNGAKTRFAKILKRGTLLKEFLSTQNDEKNGIFVDIFPIDNVPDSDIQKNIKGILSDILAYTMQS